MVNRGENDTEESVVLDGGDCQQQMRIVVEASEHFSLFLWSKQDACKQTLPVLNVGVLSSRSP